MTFPRIEDSRSDPNEGVDPLSGNIVTSEPSFLNGDEKKVEKFATTPPKLNQGFTPQPPAGLDLSVIDPLPNEKKQSPSESQSK